MLPSYYEFYSPVKINSGQNALETIAYELHQLSANKPLIITDQGIRNAGLLELLIKILQQSGLNIQPDQIFDRVPSDSSIDIVNQIAEKFNTGGFDSLIALGGGSVIDTAKGVNILVSGNYRDLRQIMGVDRLSLRLRPLVVIPTTAGTGSEATLVAVISDQNSQYKLPFVSYQLVPTLAVLDPRMTMSLPPRLTAATGMDALTHAIEAYTCLQKNPVSDAFAWKAIELISNFLVKAVENGKDLDARMAMANASLMAGIAFSNSMVGAVHAIGHALGAVSHVHHGTAMAILLPEVMRFNMPKVKNLYAELLLPLTDAETFASVPEDQRAEKTIEIIENLNQQLHKLTNMPITLSQAGVDQNELDKIAEKAINDGAMSTNPLNFDKQTVLTLLKQAF